jgi:hypothetical protein
MHLCVRICVVLAVGVVLRAQAAPFVPESDSQVLERLPFTASDPVIRELRALHGRLKDDPETAELLVDSLATCNASMSGVGSIRRTARRSSASLPRTHGVVSLAGSSI